jgi:hypothetical protein
VTKNKLPKLALRRETLTALQMQEVAGGALAVRTAVSVCLVCYPVPVITSYIGWPIEVIGG